jgi:thiamine biosynthesis lipoprotein
MPSPVLLSALMSASAVAALPPAEPETFRFHADHVLGTSLDMAVTGASAAEAQFAFAAAQAEIARLDRVLSGWRDDSELSALNHASERQVSTDLFAVIGACETWRVRSDGAFSAGLGLVEAAWSSADRRPDAQALCDRAEAASAPVLLDPARRSVSRPDGVRFAPDALAKGYILDAALAAARRAAPCAQGLMIDIGGDLVCSGDRAWRVGVADPARLQDNAAPYATLNLRGQALAVSGPGLRDRQVAGEAISHLLDPATGQPAPRAQAAVVAPRAIDADALATALAVLPPADGLRLAARTPGAEALILAADGTVHQTDGWSALTCQAAQPLPAGFQLEVGFDLPKVAVSNYKKPYLVVWVTDADKAPVKTLLILGAKGEYHEDNYVWWRRYGRKQPGLLDAMAKPTRAPGHYAVGWDGTDDKGARVPQGRYIVHVEATREHGGHTYETFEVDLGAKPVETKAPAKDELGAVAVRYGKSK